MANQVLFIHGGGDGAYKADATLAESLRRALGPNRNVRYPEMPNEDEPDYKTWKQIILDFAHDLGDGAVLVGHSIGASVLLKMMTASEAAPHVGGVFSISAPFWHDHDFWRWDEVALSENAAECYPRDIPLFLYHGEADPFVPASHLDMYAKALPFATVRRLPGRNHQLNDDLTDIARDIATLTQ